MAEPYSVLILQDEQSLQSQLSEILKSDNRFRIAAQVAGLQEGIRIADEVRIDFILLNADLCLFDLASRILEIKLRFPAAKGVLFIPESYSRDQLYIALAPGFDAYYFGQPSPQKLAAILKNVQAGEIYLEPKIARIIFDFFVDEIG